MATGKKTYDTLSEMIASPTMRSLAAMTLDCPIDLQDNEALKSALATTANQMIKALDNKRIEFDDPEDRAVFLGLLMASLEYVLDGRLKENVRRASIQ
jgi:hypothetical protein